MKIYRLQQLLIVLILPIIFSCTRRSESPDPQVNLKEGAPENVILFIGDGMGLAHVTAAQTINGGALNMTSLSAAGMMTTHCSDRAVTESAAAATAMVSGVKTNYKTLGMSPDGDTLKNIAEYLKERGYAIGVISTSYLQEATPAAFYAHAMSREEKADIAVQMAYSDVDVFIGGGTYWMNEREDGKNLIDTMMNLGYSYYENVNDVPDNETGPLLVLQAQHRLPGIREDRGDFLVKATASAISRLDRTGRPWFLMVENEHIDLEGHNNDQDVMLDEVVDLDLAVGNAMSFATVNKKTLIVVTADHECGGYSIIGGDVTQGYVAGDFQGDNHTAVMVPVFASGPGESSFTGVYDNTTLFYKFASLLGIHSDN